MKVNLTKVYGSAKLELAIEADDLKKALLQSAIFTQKDHCFLCKSTEISLEGNKDQEGNIYIKRKCNDPKCGATSNLGTYKSGGYFWKNWEIWKGKTDLTDDDI